MTTDDAQKDWQPRLLKVEDLAPLLLVQTPQNEVLKISQVYNENRVSAQVVYPVPPRTTVRYYTAADVETWQLPSGAMQAKYESAWGIR